MKIAPVLETDSIQDAYSKRILTTVIGVPPLKVLAKTPLRLQKLVKRMGKKQLRRPPEDGKWSIAQIIHHLSDSEIVLGFRLRMAIAQSGAPLQAMDEKLWANGLGYAKSNTKEKLALFESLRNDHVALLSSLSKEQHQLYGMHQERGRETVERMAHIYAGHDINHLRQVELICSLHKKDKKKGKKKKKK